MTGKTGVVFAVKLYPAGATTNSQDGVTDLFGKCVHVLEEMVEQNMPLLVIYYIRLSLTWLLVYTCWVVDDESSLVFQLLTTALSTCVHI